MIVAPTSRSARSASFRREIDLGGETTRVLVEQLGAVDSRRLGELSGHLSPEELWGVDEALTTVLGPELLTGDAHDRNLRAAAPVADSTGVAAAPSSCTAWATTVVLRLEDFFVSINSDLEDPQVISGVSLAP